MPMFKVHLEYNCKETKQFKRDTHAAKASTPEEATRMARSVFKDKAHEGQVFVMKTKLVRE